MNEKKNIIPMSQLRQSMRLQSLWIHGHHFFLLWEETMIFLS